MPAPMTVVTSPIATSTPFAIASAATTDGMNRARS
jgi:hypothetical protein